MRPSMVVTDEVGGHTSQVNGVERLLEDAPGNAQLLDQSHV